jgi:hypothetical protein
MSERKPLSVGFHPIGLLVLALLSSLLGILHVTFLHGSWRAYGLATLWVVPWHLVQLSLDYRHTDTWYRCFTAPPYRLTPRQLMALRWPAMVAALPAPFIGIFPVGVVWIWCLALYFPWQRALYVRSHREFGSTENIKAA